MDEFINTVDVFGDDTVIDSIIVKTISEFRDNVVDKVSGYVFCECDKLTVVDMPAVTHIGTDAFSGCTALKEINFPNVRTFETIGGGGRQFIGCAELESVDMPQLENIGQRSFGSCTKLKTINLPQLVTAAGYCFEGCAISEAVFPKLTSAGDGFLQRNPLVRCDFHVITSLGGVFAYVTTLKALIIRTPGVCTLNNSWSISTSSIGEGTGYVYVPRALIDSYKTATNWNTVATQFRALEDYTVDGTTTGELDETKI